MGLLDAMAQGGQPQQAPQGGLLGAMGGGGGGNRDLQMAQQLAQNPTPQVAQQIIQQLRQSGSPEEVQIASALEQAGNDSAALKRIADAAVQALSGGQ